MRHLREWTHRESNPDLQHAELVSSRWTMSPLSVDRRGLEPRFSPREGDVFPLDQQPGTVEARGIEPSSQRRGLYRPAVIPLTGTSLAVDTMGIEPISDCL